MFSSLRVRNFRLFATGQVISNSGTWMQRVAQDWLILELTHGSGTAAREIRDTAAAAGRTRR